MSDTPESDRREAMRFELTVRDLRDRIASLGLGAAMAAMWDAGHLWALDGAVQLSAEAEEALIEHRPIAESYTVERDELRARLAHVTEQRDGLDEDLSAAMAERDRARELLASTVAQCDRAQAERDAARADVSRIVDLAAKLAHGRAEAEGSQSVALAEAHRLRDDLEAEQEALNTTRSALDQRDLCYTCAGPRHGHGIHDTSVVCSDCSATMCMACCMERV